MRRGVEMRSVTALSVSIASAVALSACGTALLPDAEPGPVPLGPVPFDSVVLADDGRSARVDFIGGQKFDLDNPCSVAYEATAEVVDEELEIGVYGKPHPRPLPANMDCDAMGHSRTLTIELEEPFAGMVVRDLAGYTFLLEAPAGTAQIGALPKGWELRREGNVIGSATPRWEQVWSPDPDPWPADGDSMLTLVQAFDGPVDPTGRQLARRVEVNGENAMLSLHEPTGSVVLVWSIGGDEISLAGYSSDFSEAEFIALAESVILSDD